MTSLSQGNVASRLQRAQHHPSNSRPGLGSIAKPSLRELTAVAVISAAVLGLELALMRTLSISRWHHFAYLVVGLALLGFGASGTWLALFTPRLLPQFSRWCRGLTLTLAITVSFGYRLAETLPLDMQYILFSGKQLLYLFCFQALIFLPFLVAGFLIGLVLMNFSTSVHLIYGANLLGSGAGPVLSLGLMFWLPPTRVIQIGVIMIWAAVFLWQSSPKSRGFLRRQGLPLLLGTLLAMEMILLPAPMRLDPHKMLAELYRWQEQGEADHLVTRHGPRARLDVFASSRLHHTLFAGLTAPDPPPAQSLLLIDGDSAGPVFHIDRPAAASILQHTPMSVAYRLVPGARVLLLGEASGTNVWLARLYGATHITVVAANPQVPELLLGPSKPFGGKGLSGKDLKIRVAPPRHFLECSREHFDIIQVVGAEGMAAGVSGLLSLHEDYLLTVEGMARCLDRLTSRGLLTITRGLQSPPRDNIKILATLAEALERTGILRPAEHLAQLRNHLAVCTLASKGPLQPDRVSELVGISDQLWLDIDSLPGFDPGRRVPYNQLMGPEGFKGSFYHLAATRVFSKDRERFFKDWAYNVRPATDDRPYFYDFFRWHSLRRFIKSHGAHWFQSLELGYAVLVISLLQIVAAALLLLVLPLFLWARHTRPRRGRGPALGYFLLLGFAYLALEMSFMQRFGLVLGDPLLAAAGVLSAFLFFSGCGSLCSQRWASSPTRAITAAGLGIALLAPLVLFLSHWLLGAVCSWSTPARFFLSLFLLGPLAFLMGWPFPCGMQLAQRWSADFLPWAWGINGFASVASAPLSVLLAMSFGFRVVLALAVLCYVLTLVLAIRLEKHLPVP